MALEPRTISLRDNPNQSDRHDRRFRRRGCGARLPAGMGDMVFGAGLVVIDMRWNSGSGLRWAPCRVVGGLALLRRGVASINRSPNMFRDRARHRCGLISAAALVPARRLQDARRRGDLLRPPLLDHSAVLLGRVLELRSTGNNAAIRRSQDSRPSGSSHSRRGEKTSVAARPAVGDRRVAAKTGRCAVVEGHRPLTSRWYASRSVRRRGARHWWNSQRHRQCRDPG